MSVRQIQSYTGKGGGGKLAWLCPKKGCNYRFSLLLIVLFDLEISSLVQKMLEKKSNKGDKRFPKQKCEMCFVERDEILSLL